MIALDTSAIAAIALGEAENEPFSRIIAANGALVGTPTLLESRLVLVTRIGNHADTFLEGLISRPSIHPVAFSLPMYYAAKEAFDRFGRGRHRAKLNLGDCMAYAVAKSHHVPLLYKGGDFAHTDVVPALP